MQQGMVGYTYLFCRKFFYSESSSERILKNRSIFRQVIEMSRVSFFDSQCILPKTPFWDRFWLEDFLCDQKPFNMGVHLWTTLNYCRDRAATNWL